MTAPSVQLVVQADDFGMCHSVNEAITRTFTDGIVTQATAMVPCPWFDEAVALAKEHGIPLAMHSTLTCEWDFLRWRPLTDGPSLRGHDGTFRRTRPDARENILAEEAIIELRAQADRFIEAVGQPPIAFDPHMAALCIPAYVDVCAKYERQFIYPIGEVSMTWTSMKDLSPHAADQKVSWLLHYLETRTPGVHFMNCHPGVGGDELSSIHRPHSVDFEWAEEYRVSDLAALTAPEVKEAVERLGIRLCSIAEFDDSNSSVAASDRLDGGWLRKRTTPSLREATFRGLPTRSVTLRRRSGPDQIADVVRRRSDTGRATADGAT